MKKSKSKDYGVAFVLLIALLIGGLLLGKIILAVGGGFIFFMLGRLSTKFYKVSDE